MHPAEAKRLSKLYGKQFFILSIFSPEQDRLEHHARTLAGNDPMKAALYLEDAQAFLRRETGHATAREELDQALAGEQRYRINIPKTWDQADLFLDISDNARIRDQVERLVQLIFRHPFHTPRPEEIGMAEAFLGATESGNLARPVGAAIVAPSGDLVSIGTNDVPKAGGGIYRGGTEPDHRDHTAEWRSDPSDINRRSIVTDFLEHLFADPAWLSVLDECGSAVPDLGSAVAEALLHPTTGAGSLDFPTITDLVINSEMIRSSQIFDVIEYGRTLHAEMDALTSAARKGLSTSGSTLYCTTLPCHECARLIIGAGVRRVLFIEPYEKSRAAVLYRTEIRLTTMSESLRSDVGKVDFIPYMGISPRRFNDLFGFITRKRDDALKAGEPRLMDGRIVDWEATRRTVPVRESIVSESAFDSVSRLYDRLVHEFRTIEGYEKDYHENTGQPRDSDAPAPAPSG
jgi:cytidine deaminase